MARTKSIAVWIRNNRKANGWTQVELAKRLKYSNSSSVNLWESGTKQPTGSAMKDLEKLFGPFDKRTRSTNELASNEISEFSIWLHSTRTERNLTIRQLSEMSGVNSATISLIENGKITSPQDWVIEALERTLDSKQNNIPNGQEEALGAGLGKFQQFDPHDQKSWPKVDGVYVLYDVSDRPTYIGRGKPIYGRIKDHSTRQWFIEPFVSKAAYIPVSNEDLRTSLETILIKFMQANAMVNSMNVERESDIG
ncbi:MAG: helix-turn-helix domain-containing protein [Flavobacteriales bacterium]|nr:helix-turn-helix domain-containing protein [Flavobacteriales bacterium]